MEGRRVDGCRWGDRKTTEFGLDPSGTLVILPVGSTEQHGPHLPVDVDTRLVTEVAARTAEIVGRSRPVLVLPTLWVSLAEHHMHFAGTLTLDFATFRAVLHALVGSLARQGVRRAVILNGHGGNVAALSVIVDELARGFARDHPGLALACSTYWLPAAEAFAAILDAQPSVRHACEAETSMMLALAPDLVDLDAARSVKAPAEGFHEPGGVSRSRRTEDWTRSGVIGTPGLASAEKGRHLLGAAAAALAERLLDEAWWTSSDPTAGQGAGPASR